jgi:PAS domain S-box-containing protein
MSKAKAHPRLLVVDDDRGVAQLAARALGREGYSVETANSGESALKFLAKETVDLLLLDLRLDDLDASQIIERLNESSRRPPFLIITGHGDERVAVDMMKKGALDYLVKDASFLNALPAAVARVLNKIESERKLAAAEEALRLSEERFRVALRHSQIMVFNQDNQLRYTWIQNPPEGQTARSMLGKTDSQIFSAEDADRLTQIKTRVLLTGAGARQEVFWSFRGRKCFFDMTLEAVKDGAGNIGITGAAIEITGRKRLEDEVSQISEREQRRIGQDLHDGICQHLAGIEMKSQVLAQSLERRSKDDAAMAEEIAAHVRDVIAQTRSLARDLCPFILESEGLVSALKQLAANTKKLFNVQCHVKIEIAPDFLSQTFATHLFRIAQESVGNAIKHGKARCVTITLSTQRDNIVLTVSDDGQGFDPPVAAGQGMGLRIMQYRASDMGGTLLTQLQANGGARILCFVPKPDNMP